MFENFVKRIQIENLGILFVYLYVIYALLPVWHWGLIDDAGLFSWARTHDATPGQLAETLKGYFALGRYYPIGNIIKYVRYDALPKNVFIFRAVRLLEHAAIFWIFFKGIGLRVFPSAKSVWIAAIAWMAAFCFRDGLDLYSVSEVSGTLFGLAGIAVALGGETLLRGVCAIFLVACAGLTKEPMISYFVPLAVVFWQSKSARRGFAAVSIAMLGIWAFALMKVKHDYSSQFGTHRDLSLLTSVLWASVRNYHLLLAFLAAAIAARKIRSFRDALPWFAGFCAYAGMISLWGTTDTFNYLHIPAMPFFGLTVAALLAPLAQKKSRWSEALVLVLLILIVQTARGMWRSWVFNHESDTVTKELMADYHGDGRIWSNCYEAAGNLVLNVLDQGVPAGKGLYENRSLWPLTFAASKDGIHAGDWILESKRCDPYDLSVVKTTSLKEYTFYRILRVD